MTTYYYETKNYEGDFEASNDEEAKKKCSIVLTLERPVLCLYKKNSLGEAEYIHQHNGFTINEIKTN